MRIESMIVQPAIERLRSLLFKIDRLRLPVTSRCEVEGILVRQITRQLDTLLPTQRGHGRRTATIALAIGRTAGLTKDELHHLKLASYLHDIGQLAIDSSIHSRSLDLEDYASIQSHSRLGAQILEPFAFLKTAAVLIAHHHERWDGSGYPYGIRGPYIPVGARILAIADAFDAIEVPVVLCPKKRARIAFRIIYEVQGMIKNHDVEMQRFEIGQLMVDYSFADITSLAAIGTINWDGRLVHVRGDQWQSRSNVPHGAALTATRVKPLGLMVEDGPDAKMEGFITNFSAPDSFTVHNHPIEVSGTTRLSTTVGAYERS